MVPVVPPKAELSPHSRIAHRIAKGGKDSRGKTPGIMGEDGLWRSFDWGRHIFALPDADRWHAMGAGVGLVTTPSSRLVAIDVDTLDDTLSAAVLDELHRLIPAIGVTQPLRFGRRPKFLVMLRIAGDDEIFYRRVDFTGRDGKLERAELLCAGRYFNVLGIHPDTGRAYEWTSDLPRFDDLPVVPLALIDTLFQTLAAKLPGGACVAGRTKPKSGAAINVEALKGDRDHVTRAVRAMPNTRALFSYDDYVTVGYAIRGAGQDWPDGAQDLFVEWAEKWDGDGPLQADTDWQTFNEPRIGANWLYDKAAAVAPAAFDKASVFLAPIADDIGPESAATAEPSAEFAMPSVHVIDGRDDAEPIPPRVWAIHPWAPAHCVGIIVGAPGVSKSAFALMIAVATASGVEAVLRGADKLTLLWQVDWNSWNRRGFAGQC